MGKEDVGVEDIKLASKYLRPVGKQIDILLKYNLI
jgi:hypothetical protein